MRILLPEVQTLNDSYAKNILRFQKIFKYFSEKAEASSFKKINRNLSALFLGILISFIPLITKASHGTSPVSDIDHLGMGTFSGNYTQSSTDHVWLVFNAYAGDVINVNLNTAYQSYFWLYQSNSGCIQVGNSTTNGCMAAKQQNGPFNTGSYTINITSTGQYALQADSYGGQSGAYTITLSGSTATSALCTPTAPTFTSLPAANVSVNLISGTSTIVNYNVVASSGVLSYSLTGATVRSGVGTGTGTSFNTGITNVTVTTNSCGTIATTSFLVSVYPLAKALNFDGVDDYISVAENAAFNNLGKTGLTLEAWVKVNDASTVNSIIRKTGDYNLYINNGKLSAEIWANGADDDSWKLINGSTTISPNTWVHVAFTWDGTSPSLYVNGVNETLSITNGSVAGYEALFIGKSSIFNQPFGGSMDELRIWNRELCVEEILNNKNSELNPAGQTGLLALYHFNQGLDKGDNRGISLNVPGTPTIISTVAGSNLATISFTAPSSNGGSPITSYKVTSSPGNFIATGTASPITVTGLINGTSYTFNVIAINAVGSSVPSTSSANVIPRGIPSAPTNVVASATAVATRASISFTAPTNNGSAITSYTVTSTPGNFTATGTTSPILFNNLTAGVTYRFTVTATNAVGTSVSSAPSANFTPTTVPGAPTNVVVTNSGIGNISVSFSPPVSNGGLPITSYRATVSPGGQIATSSSSPININGLANGTYSVSVTATNSKGTSANSNSSTPFVIGSQTANSILLVYNSSLGLWLNARSGYIFNVTDGSENDPIDGSVKVAPYPQGQVPAFRYTPQGSLCITYDSQNSRFNTYRYSYVDPLQQLEYDRNGEPFAVVDAPLYLITSTGHVVDLLDGASDYSTMTGILRDATTGAPITGQIVNFTPLETPTPWNLFASTLIKKPIEKNLDEPTPVIFWSSINSNDTNEEFLRYNNKITYNTKNNRQWGPNDPTINQFSIQNIEDELALITQSINQSIASSSAESTLIDDSGNGFNGTLYGFALLGNTSNWTTGVTLGISSPYVPTAQPIIGTSAVCISNTTQLSNISLGGVWSSSNTSIATVNALGLVSGLSSGQAIISYTNTCGGISTLQITVNPLPVAAITANGPLAICLSGSVTLSANTGTGLTYQWTKDGVNIPSATLADYTVNSTGSYNVIVTQNDCTVLGAAVNVTVEDTIAPIQPILADITGQCFVTVMSAPTTTDNCAGTITGTTTNPLTYATQGTYVITWSFNDGNGNITTANQNVIVKDDTAPVFATLNNVSVSTSATTNNAIVTLVPPVVTDNCEKPAGNSLAFDGVNDIVAVSQGLPSMTEMTIETWLKPKELSNWDVILNYNTFNLGDIHFQFYPNKALGFSIAGNNPTDQLTTLTFDNKWYHFAAVYSSTGKYVKFYLNGNLIDTRNYTTAIATAANKAFSIGAWAPDNRYFNGNLDDMRIWNVARTAQEIQVSMNSTLQGNESGLLAYYDFNQGVAGGSNSSVNTVTDLAGVNNNGVLQNFALTGSTSNWANGAPTTGISLVNDFNNSADASGTYPAGSRVINWTATDAAGNKAYAQQTVTVIDSVKPVILTKNITAQLGATGSVTITPQQVNNGTSDNSGSFTLSLDKTTFNCDDISGKTGSALDFNKSQGRINLGNLNFITAGNGKYTVELWVKLRSYNPEHTYLFGDERNANRGVLFEVNPNGYLNTFHPNTGRVNSTFKVPLNTWTHVAISQDANGISIYGNGNFIQTLAVPAHIDTAEPTYIGAFTTNNVSFFRVVDGLIDELRIWKKARSSTEIQADYNKNLNGVESDLYAYYKFDEGTGSSTTKDQTSTNPNGILQNLDPLNDWTLSTPLPNLGVNVILTATDGTGNTSSKTSIVTVEDKIAPVITLNGSATVNHALSTPYIDLGAVATDNCSATLVTTGNVNTNVLGNYTITYTATDASGNVTIATRTVSVRDVTPPVVLTKNITVQLNASGNAVITPSQVNNGTTDNSGSFTLGLDKTTFDCTNLGANLVTLLATDPSGNSSSNVATLTVEDKIAPSIVGKPISVTLTANGTVSITPQDVLLSGTDNCSGTITYALSQSTFGAAEAINSPVTVQLTGTDASGNATSVPVLVTVIDPVPVVITKNITVALDANGNANITPQQVDNGSSSVVGLALEGGLALDKTTFNCANIGDNTVILTVTSSLGSTAFATAIVTVIDTIKPIVLTQNKTIQLDAAGNATITAADINNGSTDNCSIASIVLDKTTFTGTNIGLNTVTLTVTDVNGNVSTATSLVTVEDKIAPIFTSTQANVIVALDSSNGTASLASYAGNATATDNSGLPVMIIQSPSVGTSLVQNVPLTITLTATDASGNFATQTFTVTATDQTAPIALAKNITVQLDATGDALITSQQVDNGSSDNVGIVSYALDKTSFDCTNVGANTVTLTITDASGNASTATAVVTVEDKIAPIVLTQNRTIQLNAAGNATIIAADINNESTDNCSIATIVLDNTIFDCTNIGANTVTLTVTDVNGNVSTATAVVTVEDKIAPIVLTQNRTIQLNAAGNATITAADINNESTDNCSIATIILSKTSFDCTNVGANTVTLTVTDVNGNVSSSTAVVTVEDKTAPIVLTQNRTIQLDASGNATITAANINNGSTDNCSIATIVLDKTSFDCTNVGANTVTLTVTDVNGNVSSATAVVTVEDKIAPIVVTQNRTIQLDAAGNASITAADINNGSTDNCSIATVFLSKAAFDCTNVGANTVTLTVTDVNGNVSTATAVVTVEDKIAPIVLTQNRTIQLNAAGNATITAADINNGSTDNCSIATVFLSKTAFDCTNVGANTVTLTVTDVNLNISTATAVVIVEDKIAPIVFTQNITIQLNASGNAFITPSAINKNSTDNCSIASYTLSKTAFDCTNVGANTVTLTVTDVNGNVSTATSLVTVEDKIAPIITPLAFQEICFVASNTYSLPTLTATDNCRVASVSYVLSGATSRTGSGINASGTLNTGLTTITWTVRDANGNISTSSNDVRIWPLPVLTITPSNANVFCNEVSLSPSSTIPVVAYRWMYNNTLFSTSAVLKLSIANADGNYQLFVTDIHGCVNTQIASYNFQKQGAISSYTILGLREVKLGENNKVLSGSVGAMGYKGKIDIKKNSSVAAAGAFVKAADIKVQSPSNVPTKIYAPVVTSLPTMQYFTGSTKNLAKVTASSNTTLTGNYKELTVKSGKTVTLTGSLFGKIEIEEGATVTFTSSVINIENLDVEGSSKAAYTNLLFSNDAIVKVSDKVDIERRSNINPTGKKVIFYVGSVKDHGKYYYNSHDDDDRCPSRGKDHRDDDDDDDDHDGEYGNGEFKVNGGESIVNASVYVPTGKIKVNGGEKLTTNMTGMFIAYKVESSEKNVNWNGFSCSASAAPMLMATNSVQATEAPKQVIETASLELLSTKFLAYPNPFARQTTVSFTLPYQDDNATVDIYDLRGVKVQSIFKGAVAAQTAVEVQFNGQNIAAGTYFFRLTTGKETKNFKVVMID